MTCDEIDLFFDPAGGLHGELPALITEHLAKCRRCERIHRLLTLDHVELAPVSSAIQQMIARELTADLRPVSPLPGCSKLRMLLLAVIFAIILVPTAMMRARAFALMNGWQIVSIAVLLGGLAVLLASSLACQDIPGSRHLVPPNRLIVGALVLLFGTISLVFPWRGSAALVPAGLRCAVIGLTIALPAAALLWFVLRRGVVLYPTVTSASVGLTGGIAALIVLQLNCRIVEASHIVVWHLSVVLLMTVAGYLLGAAFISHRNRRSIRRT